MKINSLHYDMTQNKGSLGHRSESHKFREKNIVNDRGYNAAYCGSFTGKSKTATSFLDKILKSKSFQWLAKYSDEHNISTSALIALVLAGILRPATIMALPGQKDKEDKIYASGHAMASGIIGFAVSTVVTSPFDESIKKVLSEDGKFARKKLKGLQEQIKNLETERDGYENELKFRKGEKVDFDFKKLGDNAENLKKMANKEIEDALNTVKQNLKPLTKKREAIRTLVKNIPEWIIGVPRAILTIALIPPILKYVFGLEKKKKVKAEEKPIEMPKMDFVDKNVFKEIKGGVQ